MILIYGPAGAGKSTQGRFLAENLGRVWLSAGEIIKQNGGFEEYTKRGIMIDEQSLVDLIVEEVNKVYKTGREVVLDGQPGTVKQFDLWEKVGLLSKVECIVIIKVNKEELFRRLKERKRNDDCMEIWQKKISYFEQNIYSFITPVKRQKIPILEIDGNGTKAEVAADILEQVKPHIKESHI